MRAAWGCEGEEKGERASDGMARDCGLEKLQDRKGTVEGQCSRCISLQHQGACPLSRTVGR